MKIEITENDMERLRSGESLTLVVKHVEEKQTEIDPPVHINNVPAHELLYEYENGSCSGRTAILLEFNRRSFLSRPLSETERNELEAGKKLMEFVDSFLST